MQAGSVDRPKQNVVGTDSLRNLLPLLFGRPPAIDGRARLLGIATPVNFSETLTCTCTPARGSGRFATQCYCLLTHMALSRTQLRLHTSLSLSLQRLSHVNQNCGRFLERIIDLLVVLSQASPL